MLIVFAHVMKWEGGPQSEEAELLKTNHRKTVTQRMVNIKYRN